MTPTDRSHPAPRRVRMEEVARVAGVSPATVSRALKSPETVSERLRARVQEAAARLGYAPNRIAGSLAGARTPLVGVIVPSLTNSFFAATLDRMTTILEAEGYQLLIGQHAYDAAREERIATAFCSWNPSALVITGRDHTRGTVGLLSAAPCPVVEMWDHDDRPLDTGIGFSNREAGRLAGRYFAEQGFDKVAYVGAILGQDARARARSQGFAEQVRHLAGQDPLIADAKSRELGEGAAALRQILQRQPDTRAIAFSGDMLAVGAMFEAARMGLRIPQDLAILGYGDLDIAAHTNPPLSTIRPPHDEIGAAVARHILHRLAVPEAQSENVDLGVRLIRRLSA
ncbi:LacI family DNA-binding transcriptional regulator [Antarcticimicrobium luteum]|uniref:LacI family DNA-binding transcriptional regulator n=1 Tax=Antarcticimicrobium luteum TaxID=2547397 RepID=UPI00140A1010|nr:LacI family DNA-binding transcriptional regulator [Antarcticimicrobium luteum]